MNFETIVNQRVNIDWRTKQESDASVNFWKNVLVIKARVFSSGERMIFVEGYENFPVNFDAINDGKNKNGLKRVTMA